MHRAIALSILLFAGVSSATDTLTGHVVKVTDGDTITVLDASKTQHTIRLAGIDAPERKQAFGHASRQHLASLVAGQQVHINWTKRDKYRRLIGVVIFNGKDVNLEQVRQGLAWHYKRFEREQSPADRKLYADAEVEARAKRLGLWKDLNPMPPWEWRKRK